jgi:hypothetical protein
MNATPYLHLTLRRRELHEALTKLCPLDAVVLLDLVVRAHPHAGRLWTTVERIGSELGIPDGLISDTLERLIDRGYLLRIPARAPLLSLEIGSLLVREGEAPDNLPLEPTCV